MRDFGHKETDKKLAELEKKIVREYKKAVNETQAKLDDYLRRFEIKDNAWRKMVESGKKTAKEYQEWRTGQIMIGKRWEEMRDTLAADYHNANVIARSLVDGYTPGIYAINHNYATFEIEKGAGVDTAYTLYDEQTAARILRDNPEILPPPGASVRARIAAGKDIAWQEGQIQSVTLQSILQGESIPNMAARIASTMGESNHKATIRYARTAITGAENAGRQEAYRRAQDMGIETQKQWVATLDNRTRHEHRMLDGQTVDVDEPFEVDGYEIMFPGDPDAAPHLIWNCRCTTIASIKGFERDLSDLSLRRDEKLEDMSYEEWKEAKADSNPITLQEDKGKAIQRSYISELYSEKGVYNNEKRDIIKAEAGNNRPRNAKLEAAISRSITAERPIFADGQLGKNAVNIIPVSGYYDVVAHGTPSAFELFGEPATPGIMANVLTARKDYAAGTPIRLLACDTGKADITGNCAAQELANILRAPVEAPADTLWVYPNGELRIGAARLPVEGQLKVFTPKEE